MTAIIAILNKSAVAVSADSAVTIGTEDSHKVYNYANKVFNLSIGNPVGIMIYNSAEFCGIPWETIIKMYRKHSGNAPFSKIINYRDDFLNFLRLCTTKYFDGTEEDTSITSITRSIIDELGRQFSNELKRKYSVFDENQLFQEVNKLNSQERTELFSQVMTKVIDETLRSQQAADYRPEFGEQDIGEVRAKYGNMIRSSITEFLTFFELQSESALVEEFIEIVLQAVVKNPLLEATTGLVFTGFGEGEIFPSLHGITVGCVINGKIRYSVREDHSISQKGPGAIFPFAQTDIMETFIEGIDPQLKVSLPAYMKIALDEVQKYILSSIDGSTEAEKNLIATLDVKMKEALNSLTSSLEKARRELHIYPMINAISTLSKEDLAAMAESLINATYLHRRASFAEESVGGPVDVAVITKGDGFVWIKRKHYFDAALNLNYTSRVK